MINNEFRSTLCGLFIFITLISRAALASEALPNIYKNHTSKVTNTYKLEHEGNIYNFQEIDVFEKGSNKKYGTLGRIIVTNQNGLEITSQITRGQPGCSKEIPPLKLLSIENFYEIRSYPQHYIFFCSSDKGQNSLLRAYHPSYGFSASLEFRGELFLSEAIDGNTFITIQKEEHLEGAGWTYYPIILDIRSKSTHVFFQEAAKDDLRYTQLFQLLVNKYQKEKARFLLDRIYLLASKYKLKSHYDVFKKSLGESELKIFNRLERN